MCTHCDITHYLVTVRPTLLSMTFNWRRPLQRSITLSNTSGSALTINLCLKCKLDLVDMHHAAGEKLQSSCARTSKSELACTLCCHMLPGFSHLPRVRTDLCLGQMSFVVPECFESSNTGNGQYIIRISEEFLDNSWADRHSRVSCHCVSLCVFIPAPLPSIHFSPSLTGGGGRQWQGSLNHKTPAGHRSRQPPHKITNSLSTSKWTGPVCHTADVCVRVGWGGSQGKKGRNRGYEIKEGKEGQKQSTTQQDQVYPQGPNHNCSHWTYLTFVSLWPR